MAVTDPRLSAEAARLLYLRGKRQAMAKSIRASWFHWSWLYNLVWQIRDNYARAELADLGISVANQQRQSFTTHGPKNRQSEAALHQEVADLWQRCSMQMHHLCRANGTLYLHVLQPNQYVPNSKPLSDAEREVCISRYDDSITYVPLMYPLLQERGAALQASGVEFSDQTMIFSSVEKTLYIDLWCHFSSEGQRILGAAVAGRLLQMLDAASAADSRL